MGKKIKKRFKIEIEYPFEYACKEYDSYVPQKRKSRKIRYQIKHRGKKYDYFVSDVKQRKKIRYRYILRTFLKVYATPISGKGENEYDEFPVYGLFDKETVCYPHNSPLYNPSDIKPLIEKALEKYSDSINEKKLILFRPLFHKPISYCKWLVPKYHFKMPEKDRGKVTPNDIIKYFPIELLDFRDTFGELFIKDKLLESILTDLISIATKFDISKNLSIPDVNWLNDIKKELQLPSNAVIDCLNFIFENFTKELIKIHQLISCLNCEKYSKYFRNKKFCSDVCLRRFHSKKDYRKYREKRLPVKRRWMQKTRREIPHY